MRTLLLTLIAGALCAQTPITITSGKISGRDAGEVRAWLGIPYAAPPVGELRWKAPKPAARWDGVKAMTEYGAPCPQGGRAGQEDCLTLNVWSPRGAAKLPVMVWIHGGAYRAGTGSMPVYAGEALARRGVVVVTISYRLGDLGFFAHPELTREAGAGLATNFGLADQIAALEWVRANIAAFGGDPGCVTIFGESAGGSSVNHLMISPKARGLFHRAIAESGGMAAGGSLAELERVGSGRAADWGAADLKALRALPVEQILAKPRTLALAAYGPVVDGQLVPDTLPRLFAAGKQAPVPFLLGANSFEGSLMAGFKVTNAMVAMMVGGGNAKLREAYGEDIAAAAPQLFGDAIFVGPARRLAAWTANLKQPAWLYHFSYVMEARRDKAPGAAHGSEIPFVFDNIDQGALAKVATAADRKMAQAMSAYWVQFAKTGDPNRAGAPAWPRYEAATDQLLEFGMDAVAVRANFRKTQLDAADTIALRRPGGN